MIDLSEKEVNMVAYALTNYIRSSTSVQTVYCERSRLDEYEMIYGPLARIIAIDNVDTKIIRRSLVRYLHDLTDQHAISVLKSSPMSEASKIDEVERLLQYFS